MQAGWAYRKKKKSVYIVQEYPFRSDKMCSAIVLPQYFLSKSGNVANVSSRVEVWDGVAIFMCVMGL